MRTPRVAVVGGGLSGLTAAYQIRRDLPGARLTVYEATATMGGALETVAFPSGPMELGAEAFIRRRPEALDLVEELGLTGSLRAPGGLGSAILTGGRLTPMPAGTVMGVPSDVDALAGVLTDEERALAAREETLPLDWRPGQDASLGDLVSRRFGAAVVARLVDPMLGGVYASPSAGLGLRQVLPALAHALDDGAPSLTAAVRAVLGAGGGAGGPVFATFAEGYREFVDALSSASGARLRSRSRCVSLRRSGRGYLVTVSVDGTTVSDHADLVVVAVPVPTAVSVLAGIDGVDTALDALSGIRTASSAVVAMEIDRDFALPDHSGVLVATDEPVPYKAMTFSSRKWPHLDTRPGHLVRVSFGRLDDDEALAVGDAGLIDQALSGLASLGGSTPAVLHSRVRRWNDALAEIGPDHAERIRTVRDWLSTHAPGLALVGGATEGVGVPACIGSARAAARRLVAEWQD